MSGKELIVDHTTMLPLRVTDFDRYGRIKPSAVLSLFQEAATVQAGLMDIGHDDMERRGVFWAVIRTYYELVEQPRLYTSVQVRTWPHSPSRFSFQRDYVITSLEGRLLARGTSEWVLMSLEDRALVALEGVYEPPEHILDEKTFERKPRKIRDFETDDRDAFVIVPPYSAADINGHVNNTVYADYPLNAMELGPDQVIRSFQIDFRHEVRTGEPIYILTRDETDMTFAKGVNGSGDIAFATRMELERRDMESR